MTALGAVSYTHSNQTAALTIPNPTSTYDRAHVRFAETLDPTDGNVYHFELFPEFTGVEPDFGMVFGDMSDMADDERVKFNFRMYASGRYYNWHAVNGAWKHGVSGTRVTANGTLTIRRLTCRTETSPTTGH